MSKTLLLIVFLGQAFLLKEQHTLLEKSITLEKTTGTVQELLNELSQKGGFTFVYSNQVALQKQVSLHNAT